MMGYSAPSKKFIKDAIKAGPVYFEDHAIETSFYGAEYKGDGKYAVVGPDPYNNRKWYATLTVKNGYVVKCE